MDEAVTSIWFEVHLKQGRGDAKFLVCQVYREHKIFAIQGSEDMHQQWTRWAIFLDQWTKAMQESQEVHVLGDVNYN